VFYAPEFNLWSVSRYDDILAVLRDETNFSASGALAVPDPPDEVRDRIDTFPWKRSTVTLDPPEHRPARKLIQAPFTPSSLASREAGIRANALRLIAPLRNEGRIEFVREYAFPLSLAVIGDVIGVEESKRELLLAAAENVFKAQNSGITGDRQALLEASEPICDALEYIDALIEDRRREAQDDYTSVMVRRQLDDGSYPDTEEVHTRLFDLLVAGFETSAQMMSHGVAALLGHRDQWEALRADRSLLDAAVEEMLRYRGQVKRAFRTTRNDVVVGETTIPAGSLVALLLASGNRDNAAFEEPDTFDITRRRQDHLSFGRWTHFCVGASLARMEVRITVETLLDQCPDARVVEGSERVGAADLRLDSISRLELECDPAAA
jgi:cytochrome P450